MGATPSHLTLEHAFKKVRGDRSCLTHAREMQGRLETSSSTTSHAMLRSNSASSIDVENLARKNYLTLLLLMLDPKRTDYFSTMVLRHQLKGNLEELVQCGVRIVAE